MPRDERGGGGGGETHRASVRFERSVNWKSREKEVSERDKKGSGKVVRE